MKFDPLMSDEFREMVQTSDRGFIQIPFQPDGYQERTFLLYFRRVPTNRTLDGKFLSVVGISTFSIDTNAVVFIIYGIQVLLVVSTIIDYILIAKLCTYNTYRHDHKGKSVIKQKKKVRKEEDSHGDISREE
jgi:hypothetical protein